MKRTLIFHKISISVKHGVQKDEKVTMIMEATERTLDVFQIALEHKLQPYGWFLAKVIKPSKRKEK